MKEIKNGIVFSEDIKRILKGINAYDFQYKYIPSDSVIKDMRDDFKKTVGNIFSNFTIISEEEMLEVNRLIGGEYPHCYFR